MVFSIEKIKSAYELELKNRKPPLTADDLPFVYEDITPRWLTAVLCNHIAGAEVISHQLDQKDNGNSNRRRIFLQYNEVGVKAGLPTSVFCKATQGLANRISLGPPGCIEAEITFYNKIRPLLDIEAPVSFFGNMNHETLNSILILADLGNEARFCTHTTEITPTRIREQLGLLASYHGKFFDGPEHALLKKNYLTWPEFFSRIDYPDYEEACYKGFLAAEKVIPSRLYVRCDDVWPATRKSVATHLNLPHTLSHGDVHLRNWYINSEGKMGLSDWQSITCSHWSRDVAYLIATSLTVEQRRLWEKELLRYYVDQLQQASGASISFDGVFDLYRQQLLSALTFWTVTLNPAPGMPDFQPLDSTLEFIKRIATAIDDLEALDSFS